MGFKLKPKLRGSRFRVQACPGATGCDYEIIFIFYGRVFPSQQIDMPSLGQGFKGYNRLILLTVNIQSSIFHGQFRFIRIRIKQWYRGSRPI